MQAGIETSCVAGPPALSDRAAEVFDLFRSCETQIVGMPMGGVSGLNHGEVRAKAAECGIALTAEFWDLFLTLEIEWRGFMNPKPKEGADE